MLKLYEPQTFLFIEYYVGTLTAARTAGGIALAVAGLILLLLGMPLRRVSAALLLGGGLWATGGIIAMQLHSAFVMLAIGGAVLGLLLGGFLPRFAHAVVTAVIVALVARGGGAFVDSEIAVYTLAGGAVFGFIFAISAWHSVPALVTAMVGAFMLAFLLPLPALEHDDDLILRITLAVALMIFGLWLQFRIGEITFARVKTWKVKGWKKK